MASKRINVTFEESLLDRIDSYASSSGMSRASVLAMAANDFLKTKVVEPQLRGVMSEFFNSMSLYVGGSISEDDAKERASIASDKLEALKKTLESD